MGRNGSGEGGAMARSNRSRLASPRPRGSNIPPPLRPLKNLHAMDARERIFLEAAERGDKPTIQECLESGYVVNVNCTDLIGRTGNECPKNYASASEALCVCYASPRT